jgi:hypothetical protein
MGIISKVVLMAVRVVLVPFIAIVRTAIWMANTTISIITTIGSSFPLNIIFLLSLLLIVIMWLWPSPFTIAYVVYLRVNELFTNIMLIALNLVYGIAYKELVPFYNDAIDFFSLFLSMFWGGICEGAAPFHDVANCQGFVDLVEMLKITWALWVSYYNLAFSIVWALYEFFAEIKQGIDEEISSKRRRGALDGAGNKLPWLICDFPACDAWDGSTPRPLTNIRREPIVDEVTGKFLYSGTSWGPPGLYLVRQYLSPFEVKVAQLMARVVIWVWNLIFGKIVPAIVQLAAFQVDLMSIAFKLLEGIVEEMLDLIGSMFLFLFDFFYEVVHETMVVHNSTDYIDFGPEYTINYTSNNRQYNETHGGDHYKDHFLVTDCNRSKSDGMLERVTVGSPKFQAFLLKVRQILWNLVCELLDLPVNLFSIMDKAICLIENVAYCIPYEDFLCAWLFAPPAYCTVVQPICLLWNEARDGPGVVGVPLETFGFEEGDNPYAMIDTFHYIRYGGIHASLNPLQKYVNEHLIRDFDWDIAYHHPKMCEIYKQGKYAYPWWSTIDPDVEVNETLLHDTAWDDDENNILNAVFRYANPDLLRCPDFLSEDDFFNTTLPDTHPETIQELITELTVLQPVWILALIGGEVPYPFNNTYSSVGEIIQRMSEIYEEIQTYAFQYVLESGLAKGKIAKFGSMTEFYEPDYNFWEPFGYSTAHQQHVSAISKLLLEDPEQNIYFDSIDPETGNSTYHATTGYIGFTDLLLPHNITKEISHAFHPAEYYPYLAGLVENVTFPQTIMDTTSKTEFAFTTFVVDRIFQYTSLFNTTSASVYFVLYTFTNLNLSDSELIDFIDNEFISIIEDYLQAIKLGVEILRGSHGFSPECFCGWSERHKTYFDCDPFDPTAGPIRACGHNIKMDSHGFLFPWVEDIEVLLEEMNLGFIWRIFHLFRIDRALEEIYWQFQKLIMDLFYHCHEDLAGNCPCDACEIDEKQWLLYFVNRWIFGFGDRKLIGTTCNPNHPDPEKKCCSVSPYYSKMWLIDENLSFLDLFDECEVCPTPEGKECRCNPACPCEDCPFKGNTTEYNERFKCA